MAQLRFLQRVGSHTSVVSYLDDIVATVEPQFNEVAGDWPNLFVKWRIHLIENPHIMNTRGNDQNVRYIEVIVND